jgi:CHAD domain-containing protein
MTRLHEAISSVLPQLANNLLDKARIQAEQLGKEEGEALHDFRVSLRHLRSFLKSYENSIKGAKKYRQHFSDILTLMNAGRDNEVHLAWLKARQEKADEVEREGIQYLLEQLSSNESVKLEKVKKQFARVAKKLEKAFSKKPKKTKATFARVTAQVLQDDSRDLQKLLAKIEKPEDDTALQDVHVAGEKLRYTLELLEGKAAKPLVKKLKELQDLTGTLHDLHLLEPKVQSSLLAEMKLWSKAFRDGYKTLETTELSHLPQLQRSYGLAAVERMLEAEKTALFQVLQEEWTGKGKKDFFKDLNALIKQLAKPETATRSSGKSAPKKSNGRKTRRRKSQKAEETVLATKETATNALTVN